MAPEEPTTPNPDVNNEPPEPRKTKTTRTRKSTSSKKKSKSTETAAPVVNYSFAVETVRKSATAQTMPALEMFQDRP